MSRISRAERASSTFPSESALFFDLDGTLADSERLHWQAWHHIIARHGGDFTWKQYEDNVVGLTDDDILGYCRAEFPHLKDLSDRTRVLKQEEYLRLVDDVTPFSSETVALLRSIGHIPLALVTSSTRREAMAILTRASLLECFDVIVCLDDVLEAKPSPEPYLKAMKRLSVVSGAAFEDSEAGLASARSAGLDVVKVAHPAQLPSLVRETVARMSGQRAGMPRKIQLG